MSLISKLEQHYSQSKSNPNNNSSEAYAVTHQKGFSLIEVLVSMVLISFGLLSLGNLQTRSLHFSSEAYMETQSTLHLKEIAEMLRANKASAKLGDYNIALSSFSDLTLDTTSITNVDRYNWFNNLNDILPATKASINCGNDSHCVIELQYTAASGTHQQSLAIIL